MTGIADDLVAFYVESDALALGEHLRRGDVTAAEITEVAIRLIEAVDPHLNAVAIQTFERARKSAAAPPPGAFSGVPFLLKNVGSTCAGMPLDMGLACLRGLKDTVDTEMVRRIRAAGFVILGRTNAPECGWSIGTENRLYGATRNPYDLSRTPGGSSGGAAASVASRMVPLAEGSDGAGSIRVPASCCGVVGLKPSRGRITYGPELADLWFGSVYTLCNSRTVRDTAAFLDATAGPMVGDPYHPPSPETAWLDLIDCPTGKLRIGFTLAAHWGEAVDAEVAASVRQTLTVLEGLGHEVVEYDLRENLEAAWWSYNDIVAVEYARDFRGHGARIGRSLTDADLCPFNWAMVEHARGLTAIDYSSSIAAIRNSGQRVAQELDRFDVFVTPTLTQKPRALHHWSMEEPDYQTYLRRWSDAAYMFPFNISGLPAVSIPGTPSAAGLPIGTQLVGRYGDEATLLQVGRQLEVAAPWIGRKPAILTEEVTICQA
jgi:amidase